MKVILILLLILLVIVILLPFLGVGSLIVYVVRNSLKKKSPAFLNNEKSEMEVKVAKLTEDLEHWNNYGVASITNNIKYLASKMMSNRLTGKIFSDNSYPIIAFQRIDRGVFVNSRILARSTAFKVYIEFANNEMLVFYDDVYLGKIINHSTLYDAAHNKIGSCNRNSSHEQLIYSVEIDSKVIGEFHKNFDRNVFVTNVFYKSPRAEYEYQRNMKDYRPAGPVYPILRSNHSTTKEEEKWLLAICIFEAVYYGYDFTA